MEDLFSNQLSKSGKTYKQRVSSSDSSEEKERPKSKSGKKKEHQDQRSRKTSKSTKSKKFHEQVNKHLQQQDKKQIPTIDIEIDENSKAVDAQSIKSKSQAPSARKQATKAAEIKSRSRSDSKKRRAKQPQLTKKVINTHVIKSTGTKQLQLLSKEGDSPSEDDLVTATASDTEKGSAVERGAAQHEGSSSSSGLDSDQPTPPSARKTAGKPVKAVKSVKSHGSHKSKPKSAKAKSSKSQQSDKERSSAHFKIKMENDNPDDEDDDQEQHNDDEQQDPARAKENRKKANKHPLLLGTLFKGLELADDVKEATSTIMDKGDEICSKVKRGQKYNKEINRLFHSLANKTSKLKLQKDFRKFISNVTQQFDSVIDSSTKNLQKLEETSDIMYNLAHKLYGESKFLQETFDKIDPQIAEEVVKVFEKSVIAKGNSYKISVKSVFFGLCAVEKRFLFRDYIWDFMLYLRGCLSPLGRARRRKSHLCLICFCLLFISAADLARQPHLKGKLLKLDFLLDFMRNNTSRRSVAEKEAFELFVKKSYLPEQGSLEDHRADMMRLPIPTVILPGTKHKNQEKHECLENERVRIEFVQMNERVLKDNERLQNRLARQAVDANEPEAMSQRLRQRPPQIEGQPDVLEQIDEYDRAPGPNRAPPRLCDKRLDSRLFPVPRDLGLDHKLLDPFVVYMERHQQLLPSNSLQYQCTMGLAEFKEEELFAMVFVDGSVRWLERRDIAAILVYANKPEASVQGDKSNKSAKSKKRDDKSLSKLSKNALN